MDTTTTNRNWRTCCKKWKFRHTSIPSSKYPRLTKQSITEFRKAYKEGKQKDADLSEGIVDDKLMLTEDNYLISELVFY